MNLNETAIREESCQLSVLTKTWCSTKAITMHLREDFTSTVTAEGIKTSVRPDLKIIEPKAIVQGNFFAIS